jgi:glycosyltransferase involved in cell wall biosynthesis
VLAYADSRVYGGAEAYFCSLVRALAQSPSLELSAAAPVEASAVSAGLGEAVSSAPAQVPSQGTRLSALHLYDPRRLVAVRRLLKSVPHDVLLVNLPSAEYGATPLLVSRGRKPAVGMLHIHQEFAEVGFRLGRIRTALARPAMRRLDAVVVLSAWASDSARRLWLRRDAEAVVIPMSVPHVERADRAAARHRLGLPDGALVGIAGRITIKQKGHDTLVRALPKLVELVPDVSVAVAGDGPDEARLRALVDDAGLAGRVRMLGSVRPIDDFLAAADVLVMPSRFEGVPLLALEAAAADRPTVVSSIDGLRQLWPDEWQVPVDDDAALASVLAMVLGSPPDERDRLLAEVRRRTEALTSDDFAAPVEQLLVELATSGARSR